MDNADSGDACVSPMRMLMLAFLALVTASTAAGLEPLPEFEATYEVRYGLLSGTMLLRLTRSGDRYVYETSLQAKGLAGLFARGSIRETTTLIVDGKLIRPVDYERTDTIANPPRTARYTFEGDRVTGVYKGEPVDLPMPPGGQNRISVHIAVMHALRHGARIAETTIFDRSRWKKYRFELIPGQVVKTASGRFDTVEVRYSSPGDEKGSSVYFAPSLEFLPVMFVYSENGKAKSRAQLVAWRVEGIDDGRERPADRRQSRFGATDLPR